MSATAPLAYLGGTAAFARDLHVGQLNTPDIDAARSVFSGIFDRQFYTNHGPLVRAFEERVADYLGVSHAICMTNGTIALMVAASALGLKGEVIVPAYTFPATVQALSWAGLSPVFCDVDPDTHNLTPEAVAPLVSEKTVAVVPVHLWGRACDATGMARLAEEHGLRVLYDAAHAFGGTNDGAKIGGFGDLEMFSFHATKILSCAEGGCVTTNDDATARAIRTARNFHEQETFADVPLRINAKMSEAQAAMGLLGLDRIDELVASNRHRYDRYRTLLTGVPGVHFVDHAADGGSNFQYVVCEIEENEIGFGRDCILEVLRAERVFGRRYFYPGMHEVHPYDARAWHLPVTDRLCRRVLQLPSGEGIEAADIDVVVSVIARAHAQADAIRAKYLEDRA